MPSDMTLSRAADILETLGETGLGLSQARALSRGVSVLRAHAGQSPVPKDCFRGFYNVRRSWYGSSALPRENGAVDEICFGLPSREGGTAGEMTMQWKRIVGNSDTPILDVLSESFFMYPIFADLWDALAKLASAHEDFTPVQFEAVLLACGFEDTTESVNPREPKPECPDSPTGKHEASFKAVQFGPSSPEKIVVRCKHCRMSGTSAIPTDISWKRI